MLAQNFMSKNNEDKIVEFIINSIKNFLNTDANNIIVAVLCVCAFLLVLSFVVHSVRKISPSIMVSIGILGTFWGIYIALLNFENFKLEGGGIEEMQEQIGEVLKGMALAFITSLIGLGSAVIVRFWGFIWSMKESRGAEVVDTRDSIMHNLLTQIRDGISGQGDGSLYSQIHELRTEYRDGADTIRQSLSGDRDDSVVSHLIKMRNEHHADSEKLNEQVKVLSEKVSIVLINEIRGMKDELQKAVVEQLTAMQDDSRGYATELNEKIDAIPNKVHAVFLEGVEQLSTQLEGIKGDNQENFQALNQLMSGLSDAIHNSLVKSITELKDEMRKAIADELTPELAKTNETLRNQLETMIGEIKKALIDQFGETFKEFNQATQAIRVWQEQNRQQVEILTEAFDKTAKGIERIRADCESIPATMNTLQNLMGELDERLHAFAEMKKQAEESFPTIKQNLDSVGKDLQQSAEGFRGLQETITNTFSESNKLFEQQIVVLKQSVENCLTETQNALTQMAETHSQEVNEQISIITREWGENMVGIATKCEETIRAINAGRD